MKTILLFLLSCCSSVMAQSNSYNPSDETFANPDRGFFRFLETHSNNYSPLDQTSLTAYRTDESVTLVYWGIYLETFIDTDISESFRTNLQNDFNKIRNAGLKVIVRFAYTNNENAAIKDATKLQMLSHISQLGPFLASNADIISVVQAGLIGVYGEWYYTSQSDFGGGGYIPAAPLSQENFSNRKEIVDKWLSVLPMPMIVQVRTPWYKKGMYGTEPINSSNAFTDENSSRIGYYDDSLLSPGGTYQSSDDRDFAMHETRFVPIGGEPYNEATSINGCDFAIPELTDLHWSFLNKQKPVFMSHISECYTQIENALGYRFQLISANLPDEVALNQNMAFTLNLKNNGFAAPFNQRIAYIVLRNTITGQEFKAPLASDPRKWLSPDELILTESLTFEGISEGTYAMFLSLPDPAQALSARPEYAIRFANQNIWEPTTGYNDLNHTITVGPPLGLEEHLAGRVVLSPVPADDALTVSVKTPGSYSVTMMNTLGQEVSSYSNMSEGITIPVSNLPEGIYYVKISGNGDSIIKRIIVKHN